MYCLFNVCHVTPTSQDSYQDLILINFKSTITSTGAIVSINN